MRKYSIYRLVIAAFLATIGVFGTHSSVMAADITWQETATIGNVSSAACPKGCAVPPKGCAVKGNISFRTGEKIYHVPGQRYYRDTVIEPSKGERWFCTEQEARANGWRKSKL